MVNKEQWTVVACGTAVGTYAIYCKQPIMAGISLILGFALIVLFGIRRGGGGGGGEWDFDPAPIEPGPSGIEILDRELAGVLESASSEVKTKND